MLCQHCNQNEATVSLHMSINGQEQSLHLCPSCAQALQRQYLGQMQAMMWPMVPGLFFGETAPAHAPARRREVPAQVDACLSKRRELAALQARLDAAVKSENYEKAIELRDEISRLKNTQAPLKEDTSHE